MNPAHNKIMDHNIWTFKICFEDIYNSLPQEIKAAIDKMSVEELATIIKENKDLWAKTIATDLVSSWQESCVDAFTQNSTFDVWLNYTIYDAKGNEAFSFEENYDEDITIDKNEGLNEFIEYLSSEYQYEFLPGDTVTQSVIIS